MLCTAEVRWFWRGEAPGDVEAWFRRGAFSPGEASREDRYLVEPGQRELGLKTRGGGAGADPTGSEPVEVKGLVGRASRPVELGNVSACVELWTKWKSTVLALDPRRTHAVRKTRRLRQLALDADADGVREIELGATASKGAPRAGCNVELTRVELAAARWTTLGFEAFGDRDAVEETLRRAVAHLADPRLDLSSADALSYPSWLARVCPP